jgi:hypothetical protein
MENPSDRRISLFRGLRREPDSPGGGAWRDPLEPLLGHSLVQRNFSFLCEIRGAPRVYRAGHRPAGTGASAQPDGDTVTLPETAKALHQVLASLRKPAQSHRAQVPQHRTGRSLQRLAHVGLRDGHVPRCRRPVLVQNGDFEALQPAAFMGPEPTFYPNAPSVTLQTLTAMGHNINGRRNHFQSWRGIDQWIRQKLH